ncbi:MAG: 50S ribosomal protein L4 [Bacilli bacterium]|jgi:large subunit ribosomal protein L4
MANKTEVKDLSLPVVDFAGKKVGEVTLPADLFNVEINEYAVQMAVRVYLSNRRVATAHTLDRSMVNGSNRKPWAQKHTGRARAGTRNSPLWRHGGVVHGPDGEQSYKLKMNKKQHYLAYTSALSDKAQNNAIIVIDDAKFTGTKTKDFIKALKAINADEKKNLLVLADYDENLVRAAANLENVEITSADNLSVYDILNANKLILAKGVIPAEHDDHEEEAK